MTILPKGAKKLTDYGNLAYLFMRLLREGWKVAIISGNSARVQLEKIYYPILSEMGGENPALKNLVFYVNGGSTKITFTEKGEVVYDEKYNQKPEHRLDKEIFVKTIKKVLKNPSEKNFGLTEEETQKFIDEIQEKYPKKNYPGLELTFPWREGADWEPMEILPGEIESLKSKGSEIKKIACPWIEIRNEKEDEKVGKVAAIAIKPTPKFEIPIEGKKVKEVDIRPKIQRGIQNEIEKIQEEEKIDFHFFIGSGGETTTDISVGKVAAINDLIKDKKKIKREYVFYFGDEFYEYKVEVGGGEQVTITGNDLEIARKVDGITCVAVNYNKRADNFEGADTPIIRLGRSPQAILEFLEAVLALKDESLPA
ncbi:MAG: hypothetical protein H6556_08405 [Lewinellaceae bacterium]|nr:hypothetical protein [Lewinellaceae bacterium]